MKKIESRSFGIYDVDEYPEQNGRWGGYRCAATVAVGKQGKLYLQDDGRKFYKEKKEEELEI